MDFDLLIILLSLLGLACILLAGMAGFMMGQDSMRPRSK